MPFGSLRPSGRIRELYKPVKTACMLGIVLAVSGCGLWPAGKDKSETSLPPADTVILQTSSTAPPPPIYGEPAIPGQLPPDMQIPTMVPPEMYAGPTDPLLAAGQIDLAPGGSLGSFGVNMDTYFDETLDDDERITRVENAVTAIQRDLRRLAPPIQRLVTAEESIQVLIAQLEAFMNAPAPDQTQEPYNGRTASGSPQPVYMAPPASLPPAMGQPNSTTVITTETVTTTTAPNAVVPASYAPSGLPAVKKLRVGEHKDKTRIVLDVAEKTTYRYDLDNNENILIIELPHADWAAATQWKAKSKSPILDSYSVHPMDGAGYRVIVQLKKPTSVVYETQIKANGYPDYRIVIDLKK